MGKLPNGWTDWHQTWYTSVDSSGNGHRLKQVASRYPTAAFWGVLGGQQFISLGNVVKRLDRLGINFAHVYNACESGNGHRLNKLVIYINLKGHLMVRGCSAVRMGVRVYQILTSFSSLWPAVTLCT